MDPRLVGGSDRAVRSNDVLLWVNPARLFFTGEKSVHVVGLTSTGTAVGGTGVYWGM